MKKQLRKAMIGTIAMMLVAIVTLTGVTYAWFTESDTSVVEGIDVGIIAADGGVYISNYANPSVWGYRVTLNINETALGKRFEPVSTAPSTIATDGTLKFVTGHLNDASPNYLYPEATTKNYIKQDLYIKNDDKTNDLVVTLNPEATFAAAGQTVSYAMRLAVVDHGEYSVTGEGENDHTAGSVLTKDPTKVYIYEFDAQNHLQGSTGPRQTFGVKKYLPTIIANADGEKIYPAIDPDDYTKGGFNMKSEAEKLSTPGTTSEWVELIGAYHADNLFNITVAKAEEVTNNNGTEDTTEDDYLELVPTYQKITVYIWLEGQDADCTNAISGQDVNIQLGFTKA